MMQMQRDILAGNYYDDFRGAMIKLLLTTKKAPTNYLEELVDALWEDSNKFVKRFKDV